MDKTYETWADAFHFADELTTLEAMYQQQHQENIQQQIQGFNSAFSTESLHTEDTQSLEQLSRSIAEQLGPLLYSPEVLSHYAKLHELQQDNTLMAHQIQVLYKKLQETEDELERLREEYAKTDPQGYIHLLGRFYVKAPIRS